MKKEKLSQKNTVKTKITNLCQYRPAIVYTGQCVNVFRPFNVYLGPLIYIKAC